MAYSYPNPGIFKQSGILLHPKPNSLTKKSIGHQRDQKASDLSYVHFVENKIMCKVFFERVMDNIQRNLSKNSMIWTGRPFFTGI